MGCGTKPLCRPMRQLQCSSDESHTDTTGLSFQATTILAEVCLIVEVAIWRVAKTDTQQKMNGSAKLNLCVWWLESEVRCIISAHSFLCPGLCRLASSPVCQEVVEQRGDFLARDCHW